MNGLVVAVGLFALILYLSLAVAWVESRSEPGETEQTTLREWSR